MCLYFLFSETGTPMKDGSDNDAQAKASSTADSVADAPNTTSATDELDRDSASKG